jgi:hypothetical protein
MASKEGRMRKTFEKAQTAADMTHHHTSHELLEPARWLDD